MFYARKKLAELFEATEKGLVTCSLAVARSAQRAARYGRAMARFFFHVTNGSTLRMRRGRTALASKPQGLMLLKLPASSGKTGAMRAGITGTDSTYERGQIGE